MPTGTDVRVEPESDVGLCGTCQQVKPLVGDLLGPHGHYRMHRVPGRPAQRIRRGCAGSGDHPEPRQP